MEKNQFIYLDNASTSYPKPPNLAEALQNINYMPSSVNRRGYSSSFNLSNKIETTRQKLKDLIACPSDHKIVFTLNSTHAINLGLKGRLESGDHVITSPFEHAAVSRTLTALRKEKNIEFSVMDEKALSSVEEFDLEINRLKKSNTKMIVMNYGSNVTGELIYKPEFGKIAHQNHLEVFVDSSQAIGNIEIDVQRDNIDIMGFSCHKSLLGLAGVGALYFRKDIQIRSLITGGTGIRSENDDMVPTEESDYETGTMNTVGVIALNQSLKFISDEGFLNYINKKQKLTYKLIENLLNIDNLIVYGLKENNSRLPIVSFNIRNLDPVQEVGPILENSFNIITRTGLHCSPWTHKRIGTFPAGTVRVSPGYFNSMEDISKLTDVINMITKNVELV